MKENKNYQIILEFSLSFSLFFHFFLSFHTDKYLTLIMTGWTNSHTLPD